MTEDEFKDRYIAEHDIYDKWGKFVTDYIVKNLDDKILLRIPPEPRMKQINSIISKAYYRNKPYKNPYEEITDKVGTRFVVLLTDEIKHIADVVEAADFWTASKDRDYETERNKTPELFTYQSVHYIVKNNKPIRFLETEIPPHTPCEIQIRTLLQHAYSELTHDTIYKPTIRTTPNMFRLIARSMALIETTDNNFMEVTNEIKALEEKRNIYLHSLEDYYKSITDLDFEPKFNILILDTFSEYLDKVSVEEIIKFMEDHQTFKQIILKKSKNNFLYSQPIILYLLYLILEYTAYTINAWPLEPKYLESLFTDLGVSKPASI